MTDASGGVGPGAWPWVGHASSPRGFIQEMWSYVTC